MSQLTSRQPSRAVRVTRGAQALALVALLYLFLFEARLPAEFFTLLSLVMATGAATAVLAARDASRVVRVLAALAGAVVAFVLVWSLFYVGLFLLGEG